MRRTVEWSYQLLTPAESVLLNRLSVFAGGFTLAAAEDVCDGPPLERDAVLDALDSLVAKSLVVAEVRRGTTRYRLLETIRQFAEHSLHTTGETAMVQQRYAMHFLETLTAHVVALGETEHPTGFLWMDAEFDNLRAAFEWMLVEDLDSATRFSIPMGGFGWRLLRYEAGEWPGRVIAARNDPIDEVPAELLGAAVHGPTFGGDLGLAEKLVDEALAAGAPSTPSWQGARALGRRDRARDCDEQRRPRAATHRRGAPSARARTDPRRHDLALHRMGAPPPRRHRRESSCSRGSRPTARRQGVRVLRRLDDGESDKRPGGRAGPLPTSRPTRPLAWASSS